MIRLETTATGFRLWLGERLLMSHDANAPAFFVGEAVARMDKIGRAHV